MRASRVDGKSCEQKLKEECKLSEQGGGYKDQGRYKQGSKVEEEIARRDKRKN